MEDQKLLEGLTRRLDDTWRQMALARERGDWATYWGLRRSWLSLGRLYSNLIAERRQQCSAQLTLLPLAEGRRHDAPPEGA